MPHAQAPQASKPRDLHPSPCRGAALVVALAWLLLAPPARAEEGLVNIHAGVGAGVLVTDAAATGVDKAGVDFTLKVDYPVHRWVAPQIGYGLIYLPGTGAAEVGVNLLMFGARVRVLNDEKGFLANLWPKGPRGNLWGNLWLDFGIGYAHAPTGPGGDADWFALEVGVGCEFSVASPLQIGPYLAYRHVFNRGTNASFVAVGLSISFGYPKKLPKVDKPRPRPAPRANIKGTPGDRDGDNVADAYDKCPSTSPGAKVDEKGCEYIRGRMVFAGLQFEGHGTTLAPGAQFEVRHMAELIKVHPEVTVEVGGHTDAPGSPEENLKLSLQRAQVVRDALYKLGIPAAQLTVKGYGVTAPLVVAGTPEEKRKNIRIEFRFTVNQPKAD